MALKDKLNPTALTDSLKSRETWMKILHLTIRKGILLIPLAIVTLAAYAAPQASLMFWGSHPGLALLILFPIILWPFWAREVKMRRLVAMGGNPNQGKSPRAKAKAAARPVRPPMQPYWRAFSQWVDIVFFNDSRNQRIVYAVAFVIAIVMIFVFSVDLSVVTDDPRDPAKLIPNLPIQLVVVLIFYGIIAYRCHEIGKQRTQVIKTIYNVAATAFNYPKPGRSMRAAGDDAHLMMPSCIEVFEWSTLDKPSKYFIPTTSSTSVTDEHAWVELGENLNTRVACTTEDGWHVQRDEAGRGGMVTPADYPRGVLWDGELDPDVMTFLIGQDLDRAGEWFIIQFSTTSPHFLITGGTGTGKSSIAEAIAAQAAIKPMPWDENLIGWDIHIIDPKDAFHNRWSGRANVTSTSGLEDGYNDDGDPISGIEAMAEHMARLEQELKRRQSWLKKYGGQNAANWKDVPDELKAKTQFRPLLIITDEYLDHTKKAGGSSEQVERDNEARSEIVRITDDIHRKGRSLGMHMATVLQRANMSLIGSDVPSNAQGRVVMGNIDDSQYKSMFGTTDVPVLPASTKNKETGKLDPIPGRGRLQPTMGGDIYRIQVLFFGKGNVETLNKWLPRPEAPPLIIDGVVYGENGAEPVDPEPSSEEGAGLSETPPSTSEQQGPVPQPEGTDERPSSTSAAQPAPAAPAPSAAQLIQDAERPRPRPTPTPDRKIAEELEKINARIKDLNAIRPHDMTDEDQEELSKLFQQRKKLITKSRAQKPKPVPFQQASASDLFG